MNSQVRKAIEKQAEYALDYYQPEDLETLVSVLSPEELEVFRKRFVELCLGGSSIERIVHESVLFILSEFGGITVEEVGRHVPKRKKPKFRGIAFLSVRRIPRYPFPRSR